MRTLPMVKWDRVSAGEWAGSCEALDGTVYVARAVVSTSVRNAWGATLTANGSLVHMSEHADRNVAQLEAGTALRRAIELRETKGGDR